MNGHSGSGSDPETVTQIVSNGGRDADGNARMLGRWTFQYTPTRRFVERRLEGRVLNACAGQTVLNHSGEVVRNDLNPERDADTNLDVAEIADHFDDRSFDTIVFDPPFDEKQAETKYDGLHAKDFYSALRQFNELVRPGGLVICFGWNSWGMRSFGAFERVETTLFQRGPIHRDVIVTVDRRTSYSLSTDSEHDGVETDGGTVNPCLSVGEGDGSRAHGPARESAPHTSPPPLHTDSESRRRPGIHDVCTTGVSE